MAIIQSRIDTSSEKYQSNFLHHESLDKELHELIEMENQIYTTSFGLVGVCLLRALTLNNQEKTLKEKWQ